LREELEILTVGSLNVKMELKKIKKKMSKKGMEMDMLAWWIIGAIALVVLVFVVMMLTGKGMGAINFIKNIFRFRG